MTIEIWDPHFHIWDVSENTESGHDSSELLVDQDDPVYTLTKYEKDMTVDGFKLSGGAFVEAVSVCHVDTDGPQFELACAAETGWTSSQLEESTLDYVLVASAPLESPRIEQILESLKRFPKVCGIRQIINHKPSWPRNKKRGNYLENPQWLDGFSLLSSHNLSFDLQLNPHQFDKAVDLATKHPDIPIIIDHLGSPTLTNLENKQLYWKGMRELADLKHASIKISMLSYIDPVWDKNSLIEETVNQVIELFGVERCFFASNFPVEKHLGWSAQRLYTVFLKMVSHLDEESQQKLFADNAKKFYRQQFG